MDEIFIDQLGIIYFDNNATTPIFRDILNNMVHIFKDDFYNISSHYSKSLYEKYLFIKDYIKKYFNANDYDVIFTSGGTEGNNMVLKSIGEMYNYKGKILSSMIEHKSVLNTLNYLKNKGMVIEWINVNKYGQIDVNDLVSKIDDDVVLISVMAVNNETGVIQPIKEIGDICNKHNILFHVDGVQAVCKMDIDFRNDFKYVNYFTSSAHKFNSFKGIGFILYNNYLSPLLHGGGQENGLRSGTTNYPLIYGLYLGLFYNKIYKNKRRVIKEYIDDLKDWLLSNYKIVINGNNRIYNTLNITICYDDFNIYDFMEYMLSEGVYLNTTSACNNGGKISRSYVLKAMGLDDWSIERSIRISAGLVNNKDNFDDFKKIFSYYMDKR